MRMILVHGISQENKSEQKIITEWLTPLKATFAKLGEDPLDRLSEIGAAYYGDLLNYNSSPWLKGDVVAMGVEDADDDFDDFAVEALEAMALSIGVNRQDIEVEFGEAAVPMGKGPHKKWLKAIARAIEKVSPFKGTLALRALSQAHAYIRNQNVHQLVNDKVRPVFASDEPTIIVSHSLGTVVSYALLREYARSNNPRQSPLWLTLGSPLGIDSIRRGFVKPRIRPAHVARWVNGVDPNDFVALRNDLVASGYGPDIESIADMDNGPDSHSIAAYLSDERIARAITDAIP